MMLIAYRLGRNIVAAASPEDAVLVMERHESPGRWQAADAAPLSADELAQRVDETDPATVAESMARALDGAQSSRLRAVHNRAGGFLIRWDYPQD